MLFLMPDKPHLLFFRSLQLTRNDTQVHNSDHEMYSNAGQMYSNGPKHIESAVPSAKVTTKSVNVHWSGRNACLRALGDILIT